MVHGGSIPEPRIAWRPALAEARRHMASFAREKGFEVREEQWFGYERTRGTYTYSVNSSLDVGSKLGRTQLWFDGDSGELTFVRLPTGDRSGQTLTSWLYALHMGKVGGLPFRLFVCAVGLGVAMLSVTGVVIWLRKRRAALLKTGTSAQSASLAPCDRRPSAARSRHRRWMARDC